MSEKSDLRVNDRCGEFGPEQWSTLVWFFFALSFGTGLSYVLSQVARANYDSHGIYLDFSDYKENREASYMLRSEQSSPDGGKF